MTHPRFKSRHFKKTPGWIVSGVLFLTLLLPSLLLAQPVISKVAPTKRLIAQAQHFYMMQCARCHGEKGDGNGQLADLLDPRPRDFTVGMFKFRTTATGALPTDEDLFRTISKGIPGTTMPSWERSLSEIRRWGLVYFIKTFAEDFSDPDNDPYQSVVKLPPQILSSPESIKKGKGIYQKNQCWECHGKLGRGDGKGDLEDGWGYPLRVRNLTHRWNLKGGADPKDIVYRFSTGMDGTPMPSFAQSISGEDRWHLANFIADMAKPGFRQKRVLKVRKTNQKIPLNPEAKLWRTLKGDKVFIGNQNRVSPFWINNSVDMLEIKAVYNRNTIAFLIQWDDPFPDKKHDKSQEVKRFKGRYVNVLEELPRKRGVFRDSLALLFPQKRGLDKIPGLRGSEFDPLNMWVWKSDRAQSGKREVENRLASGLNQPLKKLPNKHQGIRSRSSWKEGRWRLVITRPLNTGGKNEVQFRADDIVPISFNVWDGSNGEHGFIMGLSSWYLLYLDDPKTETFERIKGVLSFYGVSGGLMSK